MVEALISWEDQCEDDVQIAKGDGLLCPALLELICEALESSGREPERLQSLSDS